MIDADGGRVGSGFSKHYGVADAAECLKEDSAFTAIEGNWRAMARAVMAIAFVVRIGVFMLHGAFALWHGMRVKLIAVAAQRQQGEKDGENSGAQETHGEQA